MLEFLDLQHWPRSFNYLPDLYQVWHYEGAKHWLPSWHRMYLGPQGFVRLGVNGGVYYNSDGRKGTWTPPSTPVAVNQEEVIVLCKDGTQYDLSMRYLKPSKTYAPTGTLRSDNLPLSSFRWTPAEGPGIEDYRHRFSQIHEYPRSKYLALKTSGRLCFILPGTNLPHSIRQYYWRSTPEQKRRYRCIWPLLQKLPALERMNQIYNYEGCFLLVGRSGMLYCFGHKHPALAAFPRIGEMIPKKR